MPALLVIARAGASPAATSTASISALWNRAGGNMRRAALMICPGWIRPVSISATVVDTSALAALSIEWRKPRLGRPPDEIRPSSARATRSLAIWVASSLR